MWLVIALSLTVATLRIDPRSVHGLDIEPNTEIVRQNPSTAYRLVVDVDSAAADAVFINCTNFRTFEIIPQLEADLGEPIVTSNSATLWASLNLLSVTAGIELGTLFDRSYPG